MNYYDPDILTEEEKEIEISQETKIKLLTGISEEGQVIVHCKISHESTDSVARIWRTTYLVDKYSGHQCTLLHYEGITLFPMWTLIPAGTALYFTLVFSGLPKSCTVFDFMERIPESGGFYVANILRNSSDVYHIDLSESID